MPSSHKSVDCKHDGDGASLPVGSGGAPNPPALPTLTQSDAVKSLLESGKRPRPTDSTTHPHIESDQSTKRSRHSSENGASHSPTAELDSDDADKDKMKDTFGAAGSSCHQCKSRRSINDLIFCTKIVDKKNKHCRKKYCDGCLKKFYKEEASEIKCRSSWICPSCRKMCTCAACRRRRDQTERSQNSGFGFDHGIYGGGDGSSGSAVPGFLPGVAFGGMSAPTGVTQMLGQQNVSGQNSSFAMLYAVAQMPRVRASIKQILDRKDISDEEKVEAIASLLRHTVAGGDDASGSIEEQ